MLGLNKLGIIFFISTLLLGASIFLTNNGYLGNVEAVDYIGFALYVIYILFFYTFHGFYNSEFLQKFNPDIFFWRLNEFLLTPLFYGLLAYLIDQFILSKYFKRIWLRVCILLIVFFILSIPVLILYPPFSDR